MRISAILLILLLLVSNVCNAVAADSGKGKKLLANTYQDLATLDRYHLDIIITSLIPYQNNTLKIVINNIADVQTKPVLGKGTVKMTMEAPDKAIALKMIYFFEEANKQFVCYSNTNGDKWVERAFPYTPLDKPTNHMDYITNVAVLKEDNNAIVLKVTINGNYILKELIPRVPANNNLPVEGFEQLLRNIDDFDYTVTINKKTGKAGFDLDLSDLIGQIGKNILEMDAPNARQKEELLKVFNHIKASATVTISKPDHPEAITIPAEIKAQAVELDRHLLTTTSPDPAITPLRVKTSPIIYPAEARKNLEEGTVIIKFTVLATGKLENPEILQSSGSEILDAAALDSIQQWEFFPAMLQGKPIASKSSVPITFRLEGAPLLPAEDEKKNGGNG